MRNYSSLGILVIKDGGGGMSIYKVIKNFKISIQLYLIHHFVVLLNINFLFVLFKDVMVDANFLQDSIFHEDVVNDTNAIEVIKFN